MRRTNSLANWRGGIVALVLASMLACGGLVWAVQASLIAPFVLPGAANVVVSPRGMNALRVSYRAAGQAYGWREEVWQQLTAQGWRGRDYTFGTTRQFAVTWYSRTVEFGPVTISESAVVGGEPNDPAAVNIEIHRKLHFMGFPQP